MNKQMQIIGLILCAVGIFWGAAAYNMETSVAIEAQTFGSGEYAIRTPFAKVENIGLMEERRNHLMGAGLFLLIGTIFLVAGSFQKDIPAVTENETAVRSRSKEQFYKGEPDLNDPNYQLFLTKKYSIERNNTLQKFVASDVVYDSLDDALAVFHSKESEKRISLAVVAPSANERLQALFAVVEKGEAMIETYTEIASIHDGSLISNGMFSGYTIDINGTKSRVNNFEDLRQWFLLNVKSIQM